MLHYMDVEIKVHNIVGECSRIIHQVFKQGISNIYIYIYLGTGACLRTCEL